MEDLIRKNREEHEEDLQKKNEIIRELENEKENIDDEYKEKIELLSDEL